MMNDAQKVEIVERFMITYESTLAESIIVLRNLEDPEFRRQLAESDPAKAKDLEGHTHLCHGDSSLVPGSFACSQSDMVLGMRRGSAIRQILRPSLTNSLFPGQIKGCAEGRSFFAGCV